MLLRREIIDSLEAMAVSRSGVVIVHTSLRTIGPIEGGAEGLLDALISYVTGEGGLLCIPTHTWAYQDDPTVPTLDLMEQRSNLGVFPNVALRDPRGVRTLHPTHSMAVFGPPCRVAEFVAGEERIETTTSPKGCYGKIHRDGGQVLLLGVGQDKNTYLHCVEEMLGVGNRISETPITLTVRHPDGRIEPRRLYPLEAVGIADVSEQFPNYEPAFRYHGCITDGVLGNAPVQLCSVRGMTEVMKRIFRRSEGRELLFDATPIPTAYYM